MSATIRIVPLLSVLCSVAILTLSVWPGGLNDLTLLAVLTSCLWMPVLIVIVGWMVWRNRQQSQNGLLLFYEAVAVPVAVILTVSLLVFNLPMRLSFFCHRSAFERALEQVPTAERGIPAKLRLGIYQIDEYATDPRGGIYFRTAVGSDGFGPDQMSYGFVKDPNRSGTPFGRAKYRVHGLVHGWYLFAASDDY